MSKRTLTVMEGREENSQLVADLEKEAKKAGWGFLNLAKINSDKIARCDFDDTPLDYIVFRELSLNNYHETERVFEWLKKEGKVSINIDIAGARMSTSDKHFQQGLFLMDDKLAPYALPTFEAKSEKNVKAYLAWNRVHYPIVLKPRRGTTGDGIILVRNDKELHAVKDFSEFLIEQYVEPECDFRVFVIGGVAVGAMRKVGDLKHPENFKVWCAGKDKVREKDRKVLEKLSEIACEAASVSRMEYAGVDIMREKDTGKYYILETNIAASWTIFTKVTGINIPKLVIEWLAERGDYEEGVVSKGTAVSSYINKRLKFISKKVQSDYEGILKGKKACLEPYGAVFERDKRKYLIDSGYLFDELKKAYCEAVDKKIKGKAIFKLEIMREIEKMPLSWAGNFIGPEVGVLENGMILSAMWLYLLEKSTKV